MFVLQSGDLVYCLCNLYCMGCIVVTLRAHGIVVVFIAIALCLPGILIVAHSKLFLGGLNTVGFYTTIYRWTDC